MNISFLVSFLKTHSAFGEFSLGENKSIQAQNFPFAPAGMVPPKITDRPWKAVEGYSAAPHVEYALQIG